MRWFPTKVDGWLAAVLAFAPLVTIGGAIASLVGGQNVLLALVPPAFMAALYLGLIFPMRYGVGGGELVIRHGLVRHRVRLAEILEVTPTRNPLSAPALSLDRLRVKKREGLRGSILVSPADRQGFLDLLAREAGLERRGDSLVRR